MRKFLIKFEKTFYFLTIRIPMYIAFNGLYVLLFFLLSDSFITNQSEKIIQFFFTAIALSVGLASCSFSYSKSLLKKSETNNIHKCGELFLNSAIKLTSGLLIFYIYSILNSKFKVFYQPMLFLILILKGYIYFISYVFMYDAIRAFHKGIYNIILFQQNIDLDYGKQKDNN